MRSHFEIVTSDAEQPFATRLIGDNGEQILRSSENYADVAGAERTVCIVAEVLFCGRAELVHVAPIHPDELPRAALIHIEFGEGPRPNRATLSVPVVYVDERTDLDEDEVQD